MAQLQFASAAVIGSGMMGPGIALTLALGGVRTTILSRTAEGAARGLDKARAQARLLADNGLADAAQTSRALHLLSGSARFDETLAAAGLVNSTEGASNSWPKTKKRPFRGTGWGRSIDT